MAYEIYCDESSPDLLNAPVKRWPNMLIGGLWIHDSFRSSLKSEIGILRKKHNIWGELKWSKISPSSVDFYVDLIDLFFDTESHAHFRALVLDSTVVNLGLHGFDSELGFYKFYYQLLVKWIHPDQEYRIFTDLKVNREKDRLKKLSTVLDNACPRSTVSPIQALPSNESAILQLCDVLLGSVHFKFNISDSTSSAKKAVVAAVERRLGHEIRATWSTEPKFNIFKIQLGRNG